MITREQIEAASRDCRKRPACMSTDTKEACLLAQAATDCDNIEELYRELNDDIAIIIQDIQEAENAPE